MEPYKLKWGLETIALKAIPFLMGAGLSGFGRAVGYPELVFVPPLLDTWGGINIEEPTHVENFLWMYTKYTLGATLPYLDRFPEAYTYIEGVL